ncbi:hypothetical protein EXIGLDRAFT_445425 [Exidia glandulosa HHB12029]|uniref:Uncharacterized protein n=1 Tax=Exidia glandulosa HHB12029 TaxID=1314781 RepID=A0A165B610_EXIGL|nr:hypothetical protein EXIGLDRAFT_445425 [Exidia glandulosa HHB12029]
MEPLYSRQYLDSLDRIALFQLCKRHNIAPNGANTKLRKILRQVNASPFRHNAAKRTSPVRKYRKTFSLSSALPSEHGARATSVVVEQRLYNIINSLDNSVSTFKVITLQHPVSRPRNAATSRAERRAQTSPASVAKRPKLHIMDHWENGVSSSRSARCQNWCDLMDAATKLQAGRVQAQRAGRDDAPLLLVADTPSTAIPEPPVLVPSQAAPLRVLELPEDPRPRVFKTYNIPVLRTSSSLAMTARELLAQDLDEDDASSSAGPRAGSSRASGPQVNSRRSKLSKVDRELLERTLSRPVSFFAFRYAYDDP